MSKLGLQRLKLCWVQVMRVMRKEMHLPLVNIGPEDICNGDGKLIRAVLWQLMRYVTTSELHRRTHTDLLPI